MSITLSFLVKKKLQQQLLC